LLYVRFRGPQGMQATFYQGPPPGRSHDAPVLVGLRPGYSYRVRLGNLPKHPDAALYPTVQVCGTLTLPPRAAADAYPVGEADDLQVPRIVGDDASARDEDAKTGQGEF